MNMNITIEWDSVDWSVEVGILEKDGVTKLAPVAEDIDGRLVLHSGRNGLLLRMKNGIPVGGAAGRK